MEEKSGEPSILPLKVVLLGIKSPEVIEYVETYLSETLGPSLWKRLRKKRTSDSQFELYFLMLELSDKLAMSLYERTVVRRARKRCEESTALFPVYSKLVGV
jgi:hypothetical protein